jgi:phospholipid/cholesterol/gamma-HCH transport system substrate-binding protein
MDERDPRFKALELKTGVMVALALAGVVAIMALIGVERDLFTKKYTLYFVSGTGAGLTEGMPVKLSGFKVGRVKAIELTDEAEVRVTVEMNRKYERWLRDGTGARLSKEGLIGDAFVEMTIGPPEGGVLVDGALVPFERSAGIEELAAEAGPVLDGVKEFIRYVNSPEGDIKSALANLKELAAEMRSTLEGVDRTVMAATGVMTKTGGLIDGIDERSSKVMDSAAIALGNVEAFTARLEPMAASLERMAATGEAASLKVDGILVDVSRFTGALSAGAPALRETLDSARDAAKDGSVIARGLKGAWPVSLVVPEPRAPGLVPLDGYLDIGAGLEGRPFERKPSEAGRPREGEPREGTNDAR